MAQLKAYSNTTISLAKTHGDLEDLLEKRGINASRWTHYAENGAEAGEVRLEFEWAKDKTKAPLGFRVSVEYKTALGPKGGRGGTSREQAGRALFWHVKNLMDAVDFGIVELDQAFMAHLLLPSGETAYEQATSFLTALTTGETPRLLSQGRKVNEAGR